MACEYLILNAADINIQDYDDRTPLFFATKLGKYPFFYLISIYICINFVL